MTYFQKVLAGAVVRWGSLAAVAAQMGNVPTAATLRRVWYGVGTPSRSTRAAIENLGVSHGLSTAITIGDPTERLLECQREHKEEK